MAINMIQKDMIYCHYTKIIYDTQNLEASTEICNLCIVNNAEQENTFTRPLQ